MLTRMLRPWPLAWKHVPLPVPGQKITCQWQLLLYTGGFCTSLLFRSVLYHFLSFTSNWKNCHELQASHPQPIALGCASAIESRQFASPPPSPAHWLLISQHCFSHANSSIKNQVHFSMLLTASPCKITFPFGGTKRRMTPFTLVLILMWTVSRCLVFISLQVRKSSFASHYCVQTCYSSSMVEHRVITALIKKSGNRAYPNLLLGAMKCYMHL